MKWYKEDPDIKQSQENCKLPEAGYTYTEWKQTENQIIRAKKFCMDGDEMNKA